MVGLAMVLLAGCSAQPRDIVVFNPDYGGKYEIVSKRLTADEALYVF